MKKNKIKSAFTLIELIVVSMIVVLLTSSSMFYFFDFLDQRELMIRAEVLQDDIEDLDYQVKNFHISDYSLSFSGGVSFYTGSLNTLGVDNPVVLYVDATWMGSFSIPGANNTQAWNYSLYKWQKLVENKIVPAGMSQSFKFIIWNEYKIESYLSGATINTVFVSPLFETNSGLEFSWDTGSFYNKNNNKNTIDLSFEKGWKSHTITLQ